VHATAAYEEYLAVDTRPAMRWLREALQRHFRRQFGALRFETPSWEFVDGNGEAAYEEELACPTLRAPSSELQVDELCGSALTDAEIVRMLRWRPADALVNRFAGQYTPDALESPDAQVWPADLPRPYDGNDLYLFVSYKRTDLSRIAPVMLHLQRMGKNLWYDRGIPGGTDWNATLEERLMSCSALLLFESQAAVDSKYVRREVQFADSMEKCIIRVELEAARLRFGMRLLLNHRQKICLDAPDCLAQLDRALKLINERRCLDGTEPLEERAWSE
jgi:TIR domain